MELDGGRWVYWESWILHEIIIFIKRLLFQKRQLFSLRLTWAFLFLILAHCGKNHIPFKLASFWISQFASDSPKGNFWIYALYSDILYKAWGDQWLHGLTWHQWLHLASNWLYYDLKSLRTPLSTTSATRSHKTFPKLMEMGGVWKCLLEKGGRRDLSRNGGLPYYTKVFL